MSQGQDEYRSALPERGAVIRINLNPTQGREQMGEARPCLVLSHTQFNQARQGIVIVSPITSTIKSITNHKVQLTLWFVIELRKRVSSHLLAFCYAVSTSKV